MRKLDKEEARRLFYDGFFLYIQYRHKDGFGLFTFNHTYWSADYDIPIKGSPREYGFDNILKWMDGTILDILTLDSKKPYVLR